MNVDGGGRRGTGTAKHRLWFQLRGLYERASAARRAQGLSDGQAAMERELRARGPAGARGFSGKRISEWVPAEASRQVIPQARNDDRVVALARLLAEWAGEPAPGRGLRDLLDEAREEQARERMRERGTGARSGLPAAIRRYGMSPPGTWRSAAPSTLAPPTRPPRPSPRTSSATTTTPCATTSSPRSTAGLRCSVC